MTSLDRAGADELLLTAYPRLAGWVRCQVDDDDTAHEIASEAFVRLLSRWTRVDNPRRYLYTIAANLIRKTSAIRTGSPGVNVTFRS